MRRRFFRNNETDFYKWCHSYVNKALYDVRRFEENDNGLDLILSWNEYLEALEIVRQYLVIKDALDIDHQLFLDDYLLNRKAFDHNKETFIFTKEIYHTWQEVCFPNGKSKIKTVDPFLIGHILRAERIKSTINAKQAAELIGISVKTLYAYEEGLRMIKLDALYRLSQVYNISIDELMKSAQIDYYIGL
jgi:plasmid maintenance system antidote protein VapI